MTSHAQAIPRPATAVRLAARPGHTSIIARLLIAFLLVSLLPIGSLAYLSYQETCAQRAEPAPAGGVSPAEGDTHAEGEGEAAAEAGAPAEATHADVELIPGLPVATLELGVAGLSLVPCGMCSEPWATRLKLGRSRRPRTA